MRVDLTVDVAGIVRIDERHVAIGTVAGFLRVIKGARALAGDTAGLPIVVIIEAAEPAVIVYWNVQVHFMTGRAVFGRAVAHERLHESAPVRFGSGVGNKMLQAADGRIRATSNLVERRVRHGKTRIAHTAGHMHDRVAGHAA